MKKAVSATGPVAGRLEYGALHAVLLDDDGPTHPGLVVAGRVAGKGERA